jgi:hypothetical protein
MGFLENLTSLRFASPAGLVLIPALAFVLVSQDLKDIIAVSHTVF